MDDLTRARVAAVLGNLSVAIKQLADEQGLGVADWEADVTVEKPWSTVILSDGTRVRITAEVEDVSDPVAVLKKDQDGDAKTAVQEHLDAQHVLTAVEGYHVIRFLARTLLAPDASDPAEVDEAEKKADAAFAALDRFEFEKVVDFIEAQSDHFEQWMEDWAG